MKISSIYIKDFLGVAEVAIDTATPVTLLAGRNGAGKSSVRDGIALALTADLGRVSLKKEAGQLVRTGAETAVCEVKTAEGDAFHVAITAAGKIANGQKGEPSPVLSYVLDAQRFARLDDTARRAFLYGLMGVKTDQGEIARRMEARGCHIGKVQRILPLLRSGFDAACKEAKAKATEAKGAWRTVTGETYGSEKAKTWAATVPPYDASVQKTLATELQHADVALEQWQQQVGKLQAEEQHRAKIRAALPVLHERAGRLERIAAKLATDEQQLADWEADLAKTAAAAGAGPRVGLVHDLARALFAFLDTGEPCTVQPGDDPKIDAANLALVAYENEHGKLGTTTGDSKAQARLPSVRNSRDLMASAVANDKRDLATAQAAKTEAENIEAVLAETFDAAALSEAREQIDTLKAKRAAIVTKLDAQKSIKAQIDAAEKKTADATMHAEDVATWDAIGDALAPDGIPGEILAEALGPINDRLAQSAVDAEWPKVVIAPDMSITGSGREYRLMSESERWRVDAMLAEAVAFLSGTRLLVLDRFDVLDPLGRAQLIGWLDVLADTGEIDTALIFGTLKAAPTDLPATMRAHWIEAGAVEQLEEPA